MTSWTETELATANTAKNVPYLDSLEKEIVLYMNLARLYPARFKIIVSQNHLGTTEIPELYKNSENRRSLLRDLANMKPLKALLPDSVLTETANCFSNELAESSKANHRRKNCAEGYSGENLAFGTYNAKDIVMDLLIDDGVASLGHRKNIFNPKFTKVGVAYGDHKRYKKCTVIDFMSTK